MENLDLVMMVLRQGSYHGLDDHKSNRFPNHTKYHHEDNAHEQSEEEIFRFSFITSLDGTRQTYLQNIPALCFAHKNFISQHLCSLCISPMVSILDSFLFKHEIQINFTQTSFVGFKTSNKCVHACLSVIVIMRLSKYIVLMNAPILEFLTFQLQFKHLVFVPFLDDLSP